MSEALIKRLKQILLEGLLVFLAISCGKSPEGKMIITRFSPSDSAANYLTGDGWRYLSGSQIALVEPGKPGSLKILTENFFSACSPDISWDAKYMVFAAQEKPESTWQIWYMDLADFKINKITSCEENCTDPAFLPTGKIVFSKAVNIGPSKRSHVLFTCKTDGTELQQITFHPHADFASSVIADGRVLSVSRQVLPKASGGVLMIVRPDGTKADKFFASRTGRNIISRVHESSDGKMYFVEGDSLATSGAVFAVSYNRPLHSYDKITVESEENILNVYPVNNEKLLISKLTEDRASCGIYEFDIKNRKTGNCLYTDEKMKISEVILINAHKRAKKLPSEVDMGVKTGLMLCQDVNFNEESFLGNAGNFQEADKIEVLGIDSTYGIIPVEVDGSFYLKVIADMPFRIRTLDKEGNQVKPAGNWLWLRPNERRGFISVYETPELAPENKVSLAVKKDPVNVPVHVEKIDEKEVELE